MPTDHTQSAVTTESLEWWMDQTPFTSTTPELAAHRDKWFPTPAPSGPLTGFGDPINLGDLAAYWTTAPSHSANPGQTSVRLLVIIRHEEQTDRVYTLGRSPDPGEFVGGEMLFQADPAGQWGLILIDPAPSDWDPACWPWDPAQEELRRQLDHRLEQAETWVRNRHPNAHIQDPRQADLLNSPSEEIDQAEIRASLNDFVNDLITQQSPFGEIAATYPQENEDSLSDTQMVSQHASPYTQQPLHDETPLTTASPNYSQSNEGGGNRVSLPRRPVPTSPVIDTPSQAIETQSWVPPRLVSAMPAFPAKEQFRSSGTALDRPDNSGTQWWKRPEENQTEAYNTLVIDREITLDPEQVRTMRSALSAMQVMWGLKPEEKALLQYLTR